MRKLLLMMFCLTFVLVSCSNSDDDGGDDTLSCSEATQNTLTAATNFANAGPNDFETLCNLYRISLQQQIDSCGDSNGTLQAILDDLGDCEDDVSIENN